LSWVRDFTTYQGRLNRIQLLWRHAVVCLVVRRFHDVGLSGWWLLLVFGLAGVLFALMSLWPSPWLLLAIMPVNLGYLIVLFLVPGSCGANRYGEPPALP